MSVESKILESYKITRDSTDGKSGLAVIFAFENFAKSKSIKRGGTDKEIDNLKSLFAKMNLRVHVLQDLKLQQMKTALKVITRPHMYKSQFTDARFWNARLIKEDSVSFIAVTSHGDTDGFQVFDSKMDDKDLEEYFYSDVCSILKGCPKLFLYNKCRGIMETERFEIANQIVTDGLHAPCDEDILVIYTCADGNRSLRSTESGSLVLVEFPTAYEEYGKGKDILDFIKILNHNLLPKITKKMQGNPEYPINVTQAVSVERDTAYKRICFLSPDLTTQQNPFKPTTVPVPPMYSETDISTDDLYIATSPYDTTMYDRSYDSPSPASSYDYPHNHSASKHIPDCSIDLTLDSPPSTHGYSRSYSPSNFTLDYPIDLTLDSPTSPNGTPIASCYVNDDPEDSIVIPSDEFSDTNSPHNQEN